MTLGITDSNPCRNHKLTSKPDIFSLWLLLIFFGFTSHSEDSNWFPTPLNCSGSTLTLMEWHHCWLLQWQVGTWCGDHGDHQCDYAPGDNNGDPGCYDGDGHPVGDDGDPGCVVDFHGDRWEAVGRQTWSIVEAGKSTAIPNYPKYFQILHPWLQIERSAHPPPGWLHFITG